MAHAPTENDVEALNPYVAARADAAVRQLEELVNGVFHAKETWEDANAAYDREYQVCDRKPALTPADRLLLQPYLTAVEEAHVRYVNLLNHARGQFWSKAEKLRVDEDKRTVALAHRLFSLSLGNGHVPAPKADPRPKAEVIDLAKRRA